MKTKSILSVSIFLMSFMLVIIASSASAGFLRFPAYGYSSSNALVTAFMDHDLRWNYVETYTGETGSYWDGCLAYVNGQNVACAPWNEPYPWGYKRANGWTWSTPNMNYNDYVCDDYPTCAKYMWYDNHHGYDYAVPQWTPVVASASGTIIDVNYTYGQITIDHGSGYKTIYTHMYLLQPIQQTVYKGQHIGWVSNTGAYSVHLHFVVKRNIGGTWTFVDPYGGSGQPVLWE